MSACIHYALRQFNLGQAILWRYFCPTCLLRNILFLGLLRKALELRRSTVVMDNVVWFFGDVVFVSVYDISTYLLYHVLKLLAPILALPLASVFPGEAITRALIIVRILDFLGILLISVS